MRTWTTQQERAYDSSSPSVLAKIEIEDDSGTLQDWTSLEGGVAVLSMEWKENLKQRHADGEVRVAWKSGPNNNLSPKVSGLRYSGYLGLYRRIDGYVKIVPPAADASDYSWIHVFRGTIDDWDFSTPGGGVIRWQDEVGSSLQRDWIDATNEYGDNGGAKDIEDVMGDLLTDFSTESVTLTTPTATSLQVRAYEQKKMSLSDALTALATSIGWDARPLYDGSTDWDLTLYEPTRTGASSAHTFSDTDYARVGKFVEDGTQIRNAVRVWHLDNANTEDDELDERVPLERTDETSPANDWSGSAAAGSSIDDYGWAKMELAEESTMLLRDETAAAALAEAALTDLAEPRLQATIELTTLFWPVEINDVYTFEPDGDRFDSDIDMAVNGYRHAVGGGEGRTELQLIDAPTLDQDLYLKREARPGIAPTPSSAAISAPTLTVTAGVVANHLTWDWPQYSQQQPDRILLYRSTSTGFTPSSSNLVGEFRTTEWTDSDVEPGTTYYYVARWKTTQRNFSQTSTEDSGNPGLWAESTYLDLDYATAVLRSDINGNDSDISTLQSDVSTLQSDVSSNDSDISTLQSDVSSNDSDISTLDSRVDSNDTEITDLYDSIDLEICIATLSSTQTNIASGDSIEFDSTTEDTGSNFNTTTHRYVCAKAGIHRVSVQAKFTGHEGMSSMQIVVGINGTLSGLFGSPEVPVPDGNTDPVSVSVSGLIACDSGDEIEVAVDHDAVTDGDVESEGSQFVIEETLNDTSRT